MLPLILVAVGAYLIGDSVLGDKKYAKGGMSDVGEKAAKKRLEELRKSLRAEKISYNELAELESLKKYINDDDVELRQAAGIPEFDDEDDDKLAKGGKTDGGKIKFYEIVKSISDLEYDGDPEDLRLHHIESFFKWGADNEKEYKKAENEIENLTYSGKGWKVYAINDVSGYNYWMKQNEEQNYISISVMFDADTIDESEVENLRKALGNAIDDAENIAYKYDYVPEDDDDEDDDDDDYKKGGKTQGYNDKKDESLAMKRGKISNKDLRSTHARRDDARFEERGMMGKGGAIKVGDSIRIKDGLSGKLMNIEGENLEVKKITEYPTFNGVTKFYHVEYDGYIYDVREDKIDYKRMAKGGEIDDAYREKLANYIYKTSLSKGVNEFKLVKEGWGNYGFLLWINKKMPEIEIYATPFYTPENAILFEEVVNGEDVRRQVKSYKLTGDLDKDAQTYFEFLESKTKKYAKGKMAKGGKLVGKQIGRKNN